MRRLDTRGLPPTNSKKAGDRLYGAFVSLLEAEEKVEFEEYVKAGFAVGETKDFFHVIKYALIEAGPASFRG
jgi:hypothetical protein